MLAGRRAEGAADPAEARATRERRLAGRQGFELGASLFSKVVMARDFWF
jgi:hypothetical protein